MVRLTLLFHILDQKLITLCHWKFYNIAITSELIELLKKMIGSCEDNDSNLFFASLKGKLVIICNAFIKPFINFDEEFRPVPTAVPPWAK